MKPAPCAPVYDTQSAVLPSVATVADEVRSPQSGVASIATDLAKIEDVKDFPEKDADNDGHLNLQTDESRVEEADSDDVEEPMAADADGDDGGSNAGREDDSTAGSVAASVASTVAAKRDSWEVPAAAMRVEVLATPAPIPAIVTPHVEREEERNREQFESQHMKSNDVDASIDVPQRSAPRVEKTPLSAASARRTDNDDDDDDSDNDNGVYSSSSGESEISDNENVSYAEKRIRLLKKKLEEAKRGFHPRRVEDEMAGVAFFPMLFSDDLVYNPCESSLGPLVVADQGSSVGDVDDGGHDDDADPYGREGGEREYKSAADFTDIRRVVQEHKAKLHRERLLQLYKTSAGVPEEWVSVMRKKGVDWDTFMDQEKKIRLQQALTGTGKIHSKPKVLTSPRPITKITHLQSPGPLPGRHVVAALEQITAMNVSEGAMTAPTTIAFTGLHADPDPEEDNFYLLRIENRERRLAEVADSSESWPVQPNLRPLPFGKVYSSICEIDVPQYFYVSSLHRLEPSGIC